MKLELASFAVNLLHSFQNYQIPSKSIHFKNKKTNYKLVHVLAENFGPNDPINLKYYTSQKTTR